MRSDGKSPTYYPGEACKTEECVCSRELGVFIPFNADFRPVDSTEDSFCRHSLRARHVNAMPCHWGTHAHRAIPVSS